MGILGVGTSGRSHRHLRREFFFMANASPVPVAGVSSLLMLRIPR
jgi:hypothetical protein